MAITSGFFNSVNGDRLYNAEEMSHYFDGLITNGVFESIGDKLQVTAGDGMTVNVGTGRAMIDCHWIKNDAVYNLPVDAADVQYKRCDVVVVKLDMIAREMTIEIVKGTPGTSYALPDITNTQNVKYLQLAMVRIAQGSTQIQQSMISDLRPNTRMCGYVTGLIEQVDTSQLYAQWQDACDALYSEMERFFEERKAAFYDWFKTLTDELTVDTTLQEYNNSYVVNKKTYWHEIGIPEYEYGDILIVSMDGVLLTKDVNYQVAVESGEHAQIILYKEDDSGEFVEYDPGYRLSFTVIKSVIGTPGGSTATIANAAVIAAAVDTSPEAVQGTATKEEI